MFYIGFMRWVTDTMCRDNEVGKLVIGPRGSPLSISDLPQPGTYRWVIRRKAEIVAAVRGGLLSLEEARSRCALTVEEFFAWQHSIDNHGLAGLRTTRYQQYRDRVRWNCREGVRG
jgi:Protein of unknown function (DUF1153)